MDKSEEASLEGLIEESIEESSSSELSTEESSSGLRREAIESSPEEESSSEEETSSGESSSGEPLEEESTVEASPSPSPSIEVQEEKGGGCGGGREGKGSLCHGIWRLLTPPQASTQVTGGGRKEGGSMPTLDISSITEDRTIKLEGSRVKGGGIGVLLGLMPLDLNFLWSSCLCQSLIKAARAKCFHQLKAHLQSFRMV
jgi:hypothetical protein